MSHRNDTNLPYDLSLLSGVPDPTREVNQVVRSPIFHPLPFFEIGNLSSSSPSRSLPLFSQPPPTPAHFSPRLIGPPRAPPSSSRSPTYGPATTAGECCRARPRECAVVSHGMGYYSDRDCDRPHHWCHYWRRGRRHTSQLQNEKRCRRKQPYA
ncbi:hypothetical protein BGY98DRAFT_977731 [Russula aff. rugulosa BPL654]|nr:hypothetical protein BGY98DRAFT_977731 [Russula aff. rugulosa BPL654]